MKRVFAAACAATCFTFSAAYADGFLLDDAAMDKVTAAGFVEFNTNVTKTVTINKDVFVDVVKNVATNVDLDGSLASAEASADATGFDFNIAETETFAQVTDSGAFSFSDALAAGNFIPIVVTPVRRVSHADARLPGAGRFGPRQGPEPFLVDLAAPSISMGRGSSGSLRRANRIAEHGCDFSEIWALAGQGAHRCRSHCGLAWLAGPAAAVSIGLADAHLQLTLKRIKAGDPGALQIGASVGLADQGRQASPGSTAASDYDIGVLGNPLSLGIGDGLELGSTSRSSAVGPLGLADLFTYTDGILSITNSSDERARLRFSVAYDMSALASVGDPGAEYGYGRSFIGLASESGRSVSSRGRGGQRVGPARGRHPRPPQAHPERAPGDDRDVPPRGRFGSLRRIRSPGAGAAGDRRAASRAGRARRCGASPQARVAEPARLERNEDSRTRGCRVGHGVCPRNARDIPVSA